MSFYIPPTPASIPIGPGYFSYGNPANPPPRSLRSLEDDRNNLAGPTSLNRTATNTYQYPTSQPDITYDQADIAMDSIQEANPLSAAFFSRKNILGLQAQLQAGVYKESGSQYIIGRQSDTELLVIMRGLYLQFSRYNPTSQATIMAEVQRLNQLVVDFCVPKIISAILQHKAFIRDISTPLQFPAAPINASIKGTTLLRPVTDVLVGDPFN